MLLKTLQMVLIYGMVLITNIFIQAKEDIIHCGIAELMITANGKRKECYYLIYLGL